MFERKALPAPSPAQIPANLQDALNTTLTDIESIQGQIRQLESQLEERMGEAQIFAAATETICGKFDDKQHVEQYDGSLGVAREFVVEHERPIGQIQWLTNLGNSFNGPNDDPGNVEGARWCSGAMISDDLFLTAGHCFAQTGGGWKRPRRNGKIISREEIATLMQVNFNFQLSPTGQLRQEESFRIIELVEFFLEGNIDFAIVRLASNKQGEMPGRKYGTLSISATDLTASGAMLCVIQHPAGQPKQIEAGPLIRHSGGRLFYDDIDTNGGSSGSPILGPLGNIVGVHTNGGCSTFSGENKGVSIGIIRQLLNL
ncbi:MAG: serine protease [Coleofasciculus chthonoplastes F3-SA18-01]|uniref:trypsin-like serine peptidase n=1 Tax=Coleofasciculus chthonoplastes TaxID=64178 RepID=UPI0032FC98F0